MLQKLTIYNYALIDSIEIEFDQGLNIITGETGAGKSIILGALSLILGQRAESRYFFNQDKKCIIEGLFKQTNHALKNLFESYDLDFYTENILRREISIDGKSRAFVNDTPVNLNILKLIGEKLIDIHSQHATRELHERDFQLFIIDSIAGHGKLLGTYRSDFKQLKTNEQSLEMMTKEANEALARQDYEQFLLDELYNARLQENEQAALETELEKLNHAETIKRGLLQASGLLQENDMAAALLLKEAITQLQSVERYDVEIEQLTERLRSCLIEIKDIAVEVSRIEENTIWDSKRLEFIQERLDLIYGLQQKHRVNSITELLHIQQRLDSNLTAIQASSEAIEQLRQTNEKLHQSLVEQAALLRKNRKAAISTAETQIRATLKTLEIPHAAVVFSLTPLAHTAKDGMDEIQLLFSANAGQTPAPVNKIASGGELSRLMLAIKALLAQYEALPTLIFDEIDTGISGETALKMGNLLDTLGKNMQVLSITHLPQIAARGESHYYVFKNENHSKTTTGIRRLSPEERIAAIAEMLSGKNPGSSALQNARDLLHL